MFYSEKAFVDWATATSTPVAYSGPRDILHVLRLVRAPKKEFRRLFREVKRAIINREPEIRFDYGPVVSYVCTGKWFRPWDVVPAIKGFRPPEGDYGIGIEVESGFLTREGARFFIGAISKWKHITVDFEGCGYPAEVTFPPVLYSKYGERSQASRYLKLLSSRRELVQTHAPNEYVGTHVNVSVGSGTLSPRRIGEISQVLGDRFRGEPSQKYFGRGRPYGYLNYINENNNPRIEHKMFNTVYDWRVLQRYVDIAVSLTALVCDTVPITYDSVLLALEAGYNKRNITENNNE